MKDNSISRRTFLRSSALAGAAVQLLHEQWKQA